MTSNRPTVLFLCTGNACRSQMAEGWARQLHGDRIAAYSAGTMPHSVDPRAIMVMAEAGVDISAHTAKSVDTMLDIPFDCIITVCDNAAEACPIFPGAAPVIHHGFQDPPMLAAASTTADALQHYRRVRDEIRAFITTLPGTLRQQLDMP